MPVPRLSALALGMVLFGGSVGCTTPPPEGEFIARVGEAILRDADLNERLGDVAQDSILRLRAVQSWVEHQLLLQDAEQQGIERLPEVARMLREHREAVLIAALEEEIVQQHVPTPSDSALALVFASDRDSYRLTEPYVRFHAASSPRQSMALLARRDALRTPRSDTLWNSLFVQSDFRAVRDTAIAQSRAYVEQPALRDALLALRPGQTSNVIEAEGRFHVLHVLEIRPTGAYPEPRWIRAPLEERYRVLERQRFLARYIERLRAEAESRNVLTLNLPLAP